MSHAIKHYLTINKSADVVYKAITTKEGIQRWWTPDVKIEPKVGSIAEFIFKDRFHNKMEIVDLKDNERVEWKCIHGEEEWVDTTFTFELKEKDGKTALRFIHDNWENDTEFFASCNYQWGIYLRSLKAYCETGKGEPFRPK